MSKSKVTALDVARLAGVSQPTVSRVFSSNTNVSDDKRERVLQAANKLGYRPNAIARGLTTNRTKIVGIIMKDIQNPFYPEVLELFYNKLSKEGYHLLFISSDNEQIEEKEVRKLIEYNVEGVIITNALLSSSATTQLLQNEMVVVLFNRYINDGDYSAVYCDNYSASLEIGKYFIELGHQNLAHISGPENTSTSYERERGYRDALAEDPSSKLIIENGNYTYNGGYQAATKLLARDKNIDGIFCANDISALGAIDAIRNFGLRVPEDISIIGFDNIAAASWENYSLTTWQQPVDEMVDLTVSTLIDTIEDKLPKRKFKAVDGKLIERNSVMNRKDEKGSI